MFHKLPTLPSSVSLPDCQLILRKDLDFCSSASTGDCTPFPRRKYLLPALQLQSSQQVLLISCQLHEPVDGVVISYAGLCLEKQTNVLPWLLLLSDDPGSPS